MHDKLIVIIVFLITILTMTVGYSTFATDLKIDGNAEIIGEWNVRIADIKPISVPTGCDAGTPTFTDTELNFAAQLNKPGDEIIYEVTIENAGTIDARLQTVVFLEEPEGTEAINYETTSLAETLDVGEKTTFNIIVTYLDVKEPPVKTTKTLTGIIEYVQK